MSPKLLFGKTLFLHYASYLVSFLSYFALLALLSFAFYCCLLLQHIVVFSCCYRISYNSIFMFTSLSLLFLLSLFCNDFSFLILYEYFWHRFLFVKVLKISFHTKVVLRDSFTRKHQFKLWLESLFITVQSNN